MRRRSTFLILAALVALLAAVPAGSARCPASPVLNVAGPDLLGALDLAMDLLPDDVADLSDPLVPDFSFAPMFIVAGEPVVFDASATHGGIGPYTYRWDWDDDGVPDETTADPVTTHVFTTAQVGSVSLTVVPSSGTTIGVTKFFLIEQPAGTITATVYYDANADGARDAGEPGVAGGTVQVLDGAGTVGAEKSPGVDGTATFTLPEGTYAVRTVVPAGGWMATTSARIAGVAVVPGGTETVAFGVLRLGGGGGQGPGFWSNRNGERAAAALEERPEVGLYGTAGLLAQLHLKDAAGRDFAPAGYGELRAWLTTRSGADMRYQASAQLAAMTLNVLAKRVDGAAVVYAGPALGYRTVGWLLGSTDGALAQESPDRAYLEALKGALAGANDDRTFVQPGPVRA